MDISDIFRYFQTDPNDSNVDFNEDHDDHPSNYCSFLFFIP